VSKSYHHHCKYSLNKQIAENLSGTWSETWGLDGIRFIYKNSVSVITEKCIKPETLPQDLMLSIFRNVISDR